MRLTTFATTVFFTFNLEFAAKIRGDEAPSKEDAKLYFQQGDESFSSGKLTEAIKAYSKGIEIDGSEYVWYYKRALAYTQKNDVTHALEDCAKVIEMKPSFEMAYEQRGQLYLKRGDIKEAKEEISQLEKINKQNKAIRELRRNANAGEGFVKKTKRDVEKKDYKECIKVATEALKIMPLHATLRALRADCYLEEGQVFEGVNDYIRLLGLRIGVSDKEKAKEYLRISHLQLYYLDLPAKAVEMIKTCLNQDPDNKMCLKQFKKIKKMHRKLDEIDKEYQKKKFNTLFKILETPADSSSGFIKTIKESLSESNKDFGFSESLKSRLIGRLEKIAAKSANHLKKRTQALTLAKRGLEHIPEDIELLLVKAEALIGLGTEDDLNLATQTLSHAKKSNENNSSDSRKEEFDGKIRNLEQDLHKAKRELKKRDYYKILGVSKDATQSEIKKSYRKLAKIHHPDRHKGEEKTAAEARMAEINLAYGVLGNEEERAKYDNGFDPNNPEDGQMHQHPHQHPGGFQFDFGNFQDQFFGHKRRGGFKNNFGEQFTFNFNF